MHARRGYLIRLAVIFAVFTFFLGVQGASAATSEQSQTKAAKTKDSAASGKVKGGDLQSFLQSLDSSYCQSDCCWALCPQFGGYAHCSSNHCEAWCPDGSYSHTWCWES